MIKNPVLVIICSQIDHVIEEALATDENCLRPYKAF